LGLVFINKCIREERYSDTIPVRLLTKQLMNWLEIQKGIQKR